MALSIQMRDAIVLDPHRFHTQICVESHYSYASFRPHSPLCPGHLDDRSTLTSHPTGHCHTRSLLDPQRSRKEQWRPPWMRHPVSFRKAGDPSPRRTISHVQYIQVSCRRSCASTCRSEARTFGPLDPLLQERCSCIFARNRKTCWEQHDGGRVVQSCVDPQR